MSTTVLDANQVIKKVYDEPTESLKVNATVVAQDITLVVEIDQADDSILVYGNDGSANRVLKTDAAGELQVDVLSSALPAGAATEAKQDVGNASLASIDSDIDVALSTRASESTLSTLNSKINNNYGVSTGAVRTASQIGNVSGAADFNAGVTGAQTLRTTSNITRNGTELSYNDGTSDANTIRTSANIQRDGNDLDYNIGTPSINTVRTAAILSNGSAQIDYNAGTTGAQTVRTSSNITRNGTELSYNSGTVDANTLRVTQATDVPITVQQTTHDNLNLNANIQIANTDVSDSNSVPVHGARGAISDFSGTATTTSATVLASSSTRKYIFIQNTSAGTIWFDFGVTAVAASPSIELGPGDIFVMENNFISTDAIHMRSQTMTRTFTGKAG